MPTSERAGGAESAADAGPVTARKARKRDQEVLDAAIAVFFDHGYEAASVQDIADRLGMLKGSLYHYIETKEDLLHRIVLDVNAGSEAVEASVLAEPDLGPLERLDLYVRRQLAYSLARRKQIAVYFDDSVRLSPARRRDMQLRLAANEAFLAGLVAQAQADGEAETGVVPVVFAQLIVGTLVWANRMYRPGRGPSGEALADACARYAIHGLVRATGPAKG